MLTWLSRYGSVEGSVVCICEVVVQIMVAGPKQGEDL
jgi:hypothetical protein